jgi:hypothetical protein
MATANSSSISPFGDFEQKLCARLGVASDRYLDTALRRTLYPHARLVRPLLQWVAPAFFDADLEFLQGVGRLWRRPDFKIEVWDYRYHPANRGWFRRVLRLRVSVERTQRLVESLLAEPPPNDVVFLPASGADAAPL